MTEKQLLEAMEAVGIKTQGLIYSEDVIAKLAPFVCVKPTMSELVNEITGASNSWLITPNCGTKSEHIADAILKMMEGNNAL